MLDFILKTFVGQFKRLQRHAFSSRLLGARICTLRNAQHKLLVLYMGEVPSEQYVSGVEKLNCLKTTNLQICDTYQKAICHCYICANIFGLQGQGVRRKAWKDYLLISIICRIIGLRFSDKLLMIKQPSIRGQSPILPPHILLNLMKTISKFAQYLKVITAKRPSPYLTKHYQQVSLCYS